MSSRCLRHRTSRWASGCRRVRLAARISDGSRSFGPHRLRRHRLLRRSFRHSLGRCRAATGNLADVTVRGRKVVPLTSSKSADRPFYAVAGESILVGDRVSIERALGATAAAPSLATTELYRDGRARVGNDVGLFTLLKLPKELFGKPDPEGAEPSMATLIGAPSLRGVVSGSEPGCLVLRAPRLSPSTGTRGIC